MKIDQVITEAVKLPASVEKKTPREHQPAKFDISQDDPRFNLYKNPFRMYTAGSTLLNSTLHQLYRAQGHPKIGEWQKEQIQLLDDAMYNHPIRKDMTLYHGTIQSPEIIWKQSNTPPNKPIRIHLPAYTSTSTNPKQAEKFARPYKGYKNVFEIYTPAGTPGISLKAFSRYPREDEVLLARGIELEVQPNPKIDKKSWTIYWKCAVVGHNPKQHFESAELDEAAYEGNIGMMEMFKFHQIATLEQKILMKKLIAQGKQEEAWRLLKQVTGVELKEDEYDITDTEKCDRILVELCEMIFKTQKRNPQHYGLVAACVLDGEGREVKAVNFFHKGKRIHGERAAILKYESEVGELTPDCTIITTLSPCSKFLDERYGDSCTEMINNTPVRKVYCGYSDPTNDDDDAYKHKKFHVEITRNKKIEALCKSIADIFLKDPEYLSDVNQTVTEVNPNTLKGSEGPGLPEFRRWALDTLKKYQSKFDTIYIIGSWYGNLSLMIADDDDIGYDRIINVELDKETLSIGDEIRQKLGYDFIEPMHKDANKLDYRLLGKDGLVINQCLIEMEHDQWYENIPEGTMVLLTARNNARGAVNDYHSAGEIAERYPMSKILFAGKKDFSDPETDYEGYMIIGFK